MRILLAWLKKQNCLHGLKSKRWRLVYNRKTDGVAFINVAGIEENVGGEFMKNSTGINEKKVRMAIAAFLILFFVYMIGSALWGLIGTFFVALFFFMVLNPVYKFLRGKNLGKTPSALVSMLIGLIVLGIPLAMIGAILLNETLSMINSANINQYADVIANTISAITKHIPDFESNPELQKQVVAAVSQALNYFKDVILGAVQNIGNVVLELLIFVFILYYLLVGEEKLASAAHSVIPFNAKNTRLLMDEFRKITYSALITIGLMGLIQALPLTLVFMYYGVPGAVFWGFIALIMTCVPFVGIPAVWIPVALVEFAQHNNDAAMGIVIAGIILAVIENVRPIAQKMIGKVHPLISILGIIVGINYFGVLGVVIGPLILSYAVLMARMFKEEYL